MKLKLTWRADVLWAMPKLIGFSKIFILPLHTLSFFSIVKKLVIVREKFEEQFCHWLHFIHESLINVTVDNTWRKYFSFLCWFLTIFFRIVKMLQSSFCNLYFFFICFCSWLSVFNETLDSTEENKGKLRSNTHPFSNSFSTYWTLHWKCGSILKFVEKNKHKKCARKWTK